MLSLDGDGLTLNTAGILTNGAGGVIGGNGDVSLSAGAITNAGSISALGNAALDARTIRNDGGFATAGGTLVARADGVFSNAQGQLSGDVVTVSGASIDNTSGQIAGAQVVVSSSGDLTNRGGTIHQSGSAGQTVSVGGALDNTAGTIATNAQNLTVGAQTLTNDGGSVQHAGSGTLAISTPGALSNIAGRIATNGALASQSARLDNTNGAVSAQRDANVSAANGIINADGGQLYGATGLTVTTGGDFSNAGGSAQSAGNVRIDAAGTVQNTDGVISANGASGTLAVTASRIDNRSGNLTNSGTGRTTLSAATDFTNTGGVAGGNGDVDVDAQTLENDAGAQLVAGGAANLNVASRVDNTDGYLYGGTALNLTQPRVALVNDGGSIEGGQDVSLAVASMSNAGGSLRANRDIGMRGALAGSGAMTAGRDLTLALQGDFANDQNALLHADRDFTLDVAGTLTNNASLEAGNALTVDASNVVNAVGADMNSAITTVNVSNAIVNAGVIEGDNVTTNSAILQNTGALIGNNVIVHADDATNAGARAVIAGADFVGLHAANSITNADGALIYSGGDMELARDDARDATGLLANQTSTMTNSAATIEAAGNIDVAAHTLTNERTGVETIAGTPVTTTGSTLGLWTAGIPVLAGGTFDFSGLGISSTPLGRNDLGHYYSRVYRQWDLSAGGVGTQAIQGLATPLTVTLPASQVTAVDTSAQTFSLTTPLTDTYKMSYWDTNRAQTRTITNNPTQYYNNLTQNADGTITITFWPDYNPNTQIRPDQVQMRYDLGPDSHDYVELSRTVTTTTTTDQLLNAGTPALMRAQGAIRINADGGTIDNNSSTMTAGGDLVRRAMGGSVNDTGTLLQQGTTQTNTSVFFWLQKTGSSSDMQTVIGAAVPVSTTTVAALPATATSGQTIQTDAESIHIGSVNLLGQTVTGAGVAGGDATGMKPGDVSGDAKRSQTLGDAGGAIPDLVLPGSALYSYHAALGASYLVETDPRFTSHAQFISSDYMLGQLGLDPQTVEKRLGDGLYEQQLVMN